MPSSKLDGNSSLPIAHAKIDDNGQIVDHDLESHLRGTASLARKFAAEFGGSDWAEIAGLWHDLGKYSADFQNYIRAAMDLEKGEAHIESQKRGRVNHSSAGGLLAIEKFDIKGRILAYLIAGHHAGLPDWYVGESGASALSARMADCALLETALRNGIPEDVLDRRAPEFVPPGKREGFHLWIRMLYSALVDADFLDTERFHQPTKAGLRSKFEPPSELLSKFKLHMEDMRAGKRKSGVNIMRDEVLDSCLKKSAERPGLFILEVPTGGGKTLSSMAFALNHSEIHKKKRVIYVIPFLSIIEQTADIFRSIFGENIIEHHSNLDPDEENAKSRLAAENWDAPIVVTTSVQFFESLFACRSSRCRKLHNMVNSVVILDEVQLLPPSFLQPILDALNLLIKYYGVTVVLSTATQPALSSKKWFGGRIRGLEDIDGSAGRQIIENPEELFKRLDRVTYALLQPEPAPRDWPEIAAELAGFDKVLCIVNSRKACRDLFQLMPKGTIHLSALMCGAHRSKTIQRIKDLLEGEGPVRVISTQLVEAGVDLDFPVVYRAMTGLDSIAQAAGRCNREGRLSRGLVVVFDPLQPSPPGLLRKAEDAARSVLSNARDERLSREAFKSYFELLYSRIDLDRKSIADFIKCGDGLELQFKTAAEMFRIIEEADSSSVFVRYRDGTMLIEKLKKAGPEHRLMRKLQRYAVSLPKRTFYDLMDRGQIVEISPGYFAQEFDGFYDDEIGLKLADEMIDPLALIH